VLIYVTSNRRYLLPEYESDKLSGKYANEELQQSEATEEKVSLSDRFGLWVAFHVFSQDCYVDAVKLWIERETRKHRTDIPWNRGLEQEAIKWSHDKSKRCRWTAFQFSKNYVGRDLLNLL